MAKVCKNCGVKYNNSATKCIMCGTEFDDVHIYAKRKKNIIFAIIGAVLVAVVIAFLILSTGPKAEVWRLMNAQMRNDADAMLEKIPSFLMESEKFDSRDFVIEFKATVGQMSKYIVSFNIEKAETPNSMYREELIEAIVYFADDDFNENDIEDIKIIWVNYEGGKVMGTLHSRATRFTMFKYKGEWYWWPANINR